MVMLSLVLSVPGVVSVVVPGIWSNEKKSRTTGAVTSLQVSSRPGKTAGALGDTVDHNTLLHFLGRWVA